MKKVFIHDLGIFAEGVRGYAARVRAAMGGRRQTVIFTPNFQMLNAAAKNEDAAQLLRRADILLPDGVGVCLYCRANGLPTVERIAGIDAGFALLKFAARDGKRVFLLGAERGVAERAAKNLKAQIPRLCICGTHHGYFDKSLNSKANAAVCDRIRKSAPDVLLVCFGFPEQEKWIVENAHSLPSVRIFMGLGGSLDVWSGRQKRAPLFFRALGVEWLYRCMRQPKRFISLFKSL